MAQQQAQGLTPQSARSPQSAGGLQPPQSAQTATTPGSAQPITPGPPNPAALAVATFLKNQDLKMRTCILNGQRKDMFKGKKDRTEPNQTPRFPSNEQSKATQSKSKRGVTGKRC